MLGSGRLLYCCLSHDAVMMCCCCAAGAAATVFARLLLLQSFGLNRAVMLLKGSKSKQVDPWMQELVGPDGVKLHGAGSNRSEDWWKGLGNVLVGQGYLASKTKAVRQASGTFPGHERLQWRVSRVSSVTFGQRP